MIEIASIYSTLTAAKTAIELLTKVKALKSNPEVESALIDLNKMILEAQAFAGEAQSRELGVAEKIRLLQVEVDDAKAWQSQLDKYEEVTYGKGKSAFRLKSKFKSCNDDRYACPKCMGEKHITHLQFQNVTYDSRDYYMCYNCSGEFFFGTSNGDSGVKTARRSESSFWDC